MKMVYPPKECPRYASCSVNHCPLDPWQDDHKAHAEDKEKRCPMEKGVRKRIGAKYPDLLPLLGLTPNEAAGAAKWSNLTASGKEAIITRNRATLERLRKIKAGNP